MHYNDVAEEFTAAMKIDFSKWLVSIFAPRFQID